MGGLYGLNIFVYFSKSTITTPLRVDYSYANKDPQVGRFTTSGDSSDGVMVDGTSGVASTVVYHGSGPSPKKSTVKLVDVIDRTSHRAWDVMFHGKDKTFL